jgi:hypothetical protein
LKVVAFQWICFRWPVESHCYIVNGGDDDDDGGGDGGDDDDDDGLKSFLPCCFFR